MYTLVLLRHGQSQWNLENRFTGWVDVPLTEKGVGEAHLAGKKLQEAGYSFDAVYANVLKRCIKTTNIVLEEMDLLWIPVYKHWLLNERYYGGLTGLNKSETAEKYGEEQVKIWRRSYDTRPPEISKHSEYYPGHDPRYADLAEDEIPLTECLKDVVERLQPYWQETIVPAIQSGKKILVSASGNSLRALVKYIDNISDQGITELNIPTGIPLVYELDDSLHPQKHFYLASDEELDAAVNVVKNQGNKE